MTSAHTAPLSIGAPVDELSGSVGGENGASAGLWTIPLRRMPALALAVALGVSPVTSRLDYRPADWQLRGSSTLEWSARPPRGRRVSRAEALRIVQAIGERAERERLEVADHEAARGIQWEEEA